MYQLNHFLSWEIRNQQLLMYQQNRPGSIVPVRFLSVASAARPACCAFSVSLHRTGVIMLPVTLQPHTNT